MATASAARRLAYSSGCLDMTQIDGPRTIAASEAEAILRRLPEWFGIESALLAYAAEAQVLPNFAAKLNGAIVGFVSLRQHNSVTVEMTCLAVAPDVHRRGIGTRLCAAAEAWWYERGGRLVQVKTLGPSRPSLSYERTRRFYEARGFLPVEEFTNLWPGNPCLLLIKAISEPAA
ncbi:MAG TPA: GNAT family N-acetyltransferase [Casimicrobiaceae bacterium]|nr:GNAT family N-acetyltransferase [Casimicrobiaceae bacterium]